MADERDAHLGLGLGVAPPAALMTLVQELGRRVATVDLGDARLDDAVLVRVEWDRVPEVSDRLVAWWLDDVVPDVAPFDSRFPAIALSTDPEVLDRARARGLPTRRLTTTEVEPESAPLAPFVRERIRRARELGPGWLVQDDSGIWSWNDQVVLDEDSVSTALAVCAATRVTDERSLVRAMAWGAPAIAPRTVLHHVGAAEGDVALADDGTDPLHQLDKITADPLLAARLSRRGRERYEAANSLVSCVDDVVRALRLTTRWRPSLLQIELNTLDARRGEAQRRRFDEMVASIVDERC